MQLTSPELSQLVTPTEQAPSYSEQSRLVSLKASSAAEEPAQDADTPGAELDIPEKAPDARGLLIRRPSELLDGILAAGRKGLSIQRY